MVGREPEEAALQVLYSAKPCWAEIRSLAAGRRVAEGRARGRRPTVYNFIKPHYRLSLRMDSAARVDRVYSSFEARQILLVEWENLLLRRLGYPAVTSASISTSTCRRTRQTSRT